MSIFTEEVAAKIEELKSQRLTWAEINNRLNLCKTTDSLKSAYNYHVRQQSQKHQEEPQIPLQNTKNLPRSHSSTINPPELPKSLAKEWAIHKLQGRMIGVISDIHLPYHDETAVECAVAHLLDRKIDTLLLNGDVMDFYQASRFTRDPTRARIKQELEIGKQFLGWLRGKFPDIEILWKMGNHEERWYTYLAERAPDLFEIASNIWWDVVGAKEHDIVMLTDQTRVYAGKLLILHGHELGRGTSTPVNPARTLGLRALESGLIGHFHRTSENSMHTISGNSIITRSTGCMCFLHPDYARVNQWDHGFAVVTVESSGDYSCELKKIIKGKVY